MNLFLKGRSFNITGTPGPFHSANPPLYDASSLLEHPKGTVLNYFMKKKNRCDIHIREMLMTYQLDPDVNRCIDKSVYSPFLQLK